MPARSSGAGSMRLPHLDKGAASGRSPWRRRGGRPARCAVPSPGMLALGLEHDAGGAGLERLEGGSAVAHPFREEGEAPPSARSSWQRAKVSAFFEGSDPLVLAAVDGDGLGELQEGADEGVLPQGALGEEPRHHGQGSSSRSGSMSPLTWLAARTSGRSRGDALGAHHLDFAEEDLRRSRERPRRKRSAALTPGPLSRPSTLPCQGEGETPGRDQSPSSPREGEGGPGEEGRGGRDSTPPPRLSPASHPRRPSR